MKGNLKLSDTVGSDTGKKIHTYIFASTMLKYKNKLMLRENSIL